MTGVEHLAQCEQRAFEYCDRGDLKGALLSINADLQSFKEGTYRPITTEHIEELAQYVKTPTQMRSFVQGFFRGLYA